MTPGPQSPAWYGHIHPSEWLEARIIRCFHKNILNPLEHRAESWVFTIFGPSRPWEPILRLTLTSSACCQQLFLPQFLLCHHCSGYACLLQTLAQADESKKETLKKKWIWVNFWNLWGQREPNFMATQPKSVPWGKPFLLLWLAACPVSQTHGACCQKSQIELSFVPPVNYQWQSLLLKVLPYNSGCAKY